MDLFKSRTLLGYTEQLVHVRDDVQKVEYIGFNRLLMGDWDIPDDFHFHDGSVTVPNREYVLGILHRDVSQRPNHFWRVYQTPGGVRAFLTSDFQVFCAEVHSALMKDLSIDPVYRDIATAQRAWWCRVSPKIGRPGDYVAKPWTTVKGTDGIESLDALLAVKEHDRLCQRKFPFYHRVEVSCPTCRLRNSYFHGPCSFCNRTGRKVLAVGSEELPFLLAIEADQLDDAPRLVYSDWLIDQGRDQDAEVMRQIPSSAIRIIRPSNTAPTVDPTEPAEIPF
jgi:uncharacterized protein (TIGR02996 family)